MNQADNKHIATLLIGNPSDEEILVNLEGKYSHYIQKSRRIRRQWLINAAFARSQQFCILHDTDDRLVYLSAPEGKKLITDDKISPWKERTAANIVAAIPEFTAEPENIEGSAVMSARMSSALLEHYWRDWNFKSKFIGLANHLIDFGNAVGYVNYIEDGTKFDLEELKDPDTGDTAIDEITNLPVTIPHPIGDVEVDIYPPHYLVCPLDPSPLQDKPWIMIVPKRSKEYLVSIYGEKAKDINDDGNRITGTHGNTYDLESISRISKYTASDTEYDEINEFIYMQKPNVLEPKGKIIVMAGKKILYNEPWAYTKLMTYPVVLFQYPTEADEFFARSKIDMQIPLQRTLNLAWSILTENYDDMVHIKWKIPHQAEVDSITDDTSFIRYNAPFEPTQSEVRGLPSWAVNFIPMLYNAIQDAQSSHGATQGQSEEGVRANIHAQNLIEQDMLPLSVLDDKLEEGFAELGTIVLKIGAEYLTDERFISITGVSGSRQMIRFKNDMLGNTKKVSVRLVNRHMRNKAQTEQTIVGLAQMGLITDNKGQPDSDRLLRMLEFAIPEGEFDLMRRQTEQAYHENDLMMIGQQARLMPWQNHKTHAGIHEELLNSKEFMELYDDADKNKDIIKMVTTHWVKTNEAYIKNLKLLQPPEPQPGKPEKEPAQKQKPAKENNQLVGARQ